MQVFISYSSDSKRWAQKLAEALRSNEITPWLDDEKVKPGAAWQAEIEKAIKSSSSVVGLFGPHAQDEQSQRWKWAEILDASLEEKEKPLIPVLLNDAQLPGFLHGFQAIIVKDPSREWDEAVESLIGVLKKKKKLDEVRLAETVAVSEEAKTEQRKRLLYIGKVAESQKSARKGSAESVRTHTRGRNTSREPDEEKGIRQEGRRQKDRRQKGRQEDSRQETGQD